MTQSSKKHVAILAGGWDSEAEISRASAKKVMAALKERSYKASLIEMPRDLKILIAKIDDLKPDIIFNALHGGAGEDGTIQGVLDFIKIPYTHSGVKSSAISMDKSLSKLLAASAGLTLAPSDFVKVNGFKNYRPSFEGPYVIKPNEGGSSFGIHFIDTLSQEKSIQLHDLFQSDLAIYGKGLLVEKEIKGRELSVSVLDGKALTVTEIIPKNDYYDYESKYTAGGSEHTIPADIPPIIFEKALRDAEKLNQKMGTPFLSRVEYLYDEKDQALVLLELNIQPGLSPTSLVPEQAEYCGISFADLVERLIENPILPAF